MNKLTSNNYLYLFIFIIFFTPKLLAQSGSIDSLLNVFNQSTVDSNKVKIIDKIIDELFYEEPKEALSYAKQQQILIAKDAYEQQIANYNTLGVLAYYLGDFSEAILYFNQEVALIQEHGSQEFSVYEEHSNFAMCYSELGDKKTALDYLFKGLEAAEENEMSDLEFHCLREIGDIYSNLGEHTKALSYQKECLLILNKDTSNLEYKDKLCYINLELGRTYTQLDSMPIAYVYLNQGLKIAEENQFKSYKIKAFSELSFWASKKTAYKKSIEYSLNALNLTKERDNFFSISRLHLNLAKSYVKERQYFQAIAHLNKSIQISRENDYFDPLIAAKKELHHIYLKTKAYQNASFLGEEIITLSDSLESLKYQEKFAQMEVLHDVKNKEQELLIQELKLKEQQVIIREKNIIQWGLLAFSLLLLGFLGSVYYSFQLKTKKNLELHQLNELIKIQTKEVESANSSLKSFSRMVSHDILSQIDLIISLSNQKNWTKPGISKDELLEKTKETAISLKRFSLGLIALSGVEEETKPLEDIDLNKITKQVVNNLSQKIIETAAVINISDLPTIAAHETQMIQLFQNLIDNSIKYKVDNRKTVIEVGIKQRKEEYLFFVKDNGVGIAKDKQELVFQSFYQEEGNERRIGEGLGLSICEKIVEYYDGKIWLESELGKGTTVYFSYPK